MSSKRGGSKTPGSSPPNSKPTGKGWIEALQKELTVVSEPPEGYTWSVDIAAKMGISKSSASHIVQKLMSAGVPEVTVRCEGRQRIYFKDEVT